MVLQLDPTTVGSLGADLRALRKARGLTLQAMAGALGRSVGWISQVERDLSEPSIKDLQQFAAMLDVGMSTLFQSWHDARGRRWLCRPKRHAAAYWIAH